MNSRSISGPVAEARIDLDSGSEWKVASQLHRGVAKDFAGVQKLFKFQVFA